MSVGPNQPVDMNTAEQARQRVNRLTEEIVHLSEQELSPAEYYGEFLQRILNVMEAPAGAVWVRTPQGNLQLQYQINMVQAGLDRAENSREMHGELIRQATMKGQPGIFPPHSSTGENGPGNPTDLFILLAPIIYDKQVAGMVEIWHHPMRGPDAMRQFLAFIVRMAALAAGYTRNHQLRQMVGQQQVWVQLEAFARQIHASLHPTEVSYIVSNEGRRLTEADRISVALRTAKKPYVTAISGADVVETRSNLVQLMRKLFEEVMIWGERLIYSGSKDESLPPAVNKALDLYLAESNSKMLVVMPLKDEREKDGTNLPRSALMMECFEPNANAEQMMARLDVVGRHATSALYNAAEHRRIPFRFIWMPIAALQEGLGGKTKAIVTAVGVALLILVLCLIFVPYPLKMEAKGQLLPRDRVYVYSPVEGRIKRIEPGLKSGEYVDKGAILFNVFDKGLASQLTDMDMAIAQAMQTANQQIADPNKDPQRVIDKEKAKTELFYKKKARDELMKMTNSKEINGEFEILAPMAGIILTPEFRETLNDRAIKPNEQLLRIGNVSRSPAKRTVQEWELELKIPQKHVGQVLRAYMDLPPGKELDVDLLVMTAPTRMFKAKLARDKIAYQASPNKDDPTDQEAVVLAWARLHGSDIEEEYRIPPELLLSTVEVHVKIRCGPHAMGYSLFYGVWEFLYEKVIFWF
jgi:hypothetical protein